MILRIRTKNDTNGNPRRAWVRLDPNTGSAIAWYDEGYEGSRAVPEDIRHHIAGALDIVVAPSGFNALRKTILSRQHAAAL